MVRNNGVMGASDYDRAAYEYLESLPLEHFMETIPQAKQREITLSSLALLRARRPDVQYFNELLVQYIFEDRLCQVVPDNMVVIGSQPLQSTINYAVELEPVSPFLVLEYVSPASRRKDYGESFVKYEQELKAPYCILFEPEIGKLGVHHHEGTGYVALRANRQGRFPIPELDLEVGLLDGWLRFWYQGELLELPAELHRRLAEQSEQIAEQSEQIAEQSEQIAELSERVAEQSDQIAEQAGKIQEFESERNRVTLRLQRMVERQAMRVGRQDILARLPATTDLQRLEQWADELQCW